MDNKLSEIIFMNGNEDDISVIYACYLAMLRIDIYK